MLRLKRVAFTLAEVLIALALIGILSAMAIQTMQQNDHKAEFDALKKKSVTNIQGSMRLALYETKSSEIYAGENGNITELWDNVLKKIEHKELKKQTNNWKFELDSETDWEFHGMRDGTYFAFDKSEDADSELLSRVAIDVNAEAGPNKDGYDQVLFYMDKYGGFNPTPPPYKGCEDGTIWVAACQDCKVPCNMPRAYVDNGTSCDCVCPAPKTKWNGSDCVCPDDVPNFYNGVCNKCEEGKIESEGHCCNEGEFWDGTKCTENSSPQDCPSNCIKYPYGDKTLCLDKNPWDCKDGTVWNIEHGACFIPHIVEELTEDDIETLNQQTPGMVCSSMTEASHHFSCATSVMSPVYGYISEKYFGVLRENWEHPERLFSVWAYEHTFVEGINEISCSRILSGTFPYGQVSVNCDKYSSSYEYSSLGIPANEHKSGYWKAIGRVMLKSANAEIDRINLSRKKALHDSLKECPDKSETTSCCHIKHNSEQEEPFLGGDTDTENPDDDNNNDGGGNDEPEEPFLDCENRPESPGCTGWNPDDTDEDDQAVQFD